MDYLWHQCQFVLEEGWTWIKDQVSGHLIRSVVIAVAIVILWFILTPRLGGND